jgi:hypothetical protein
VPVSAPIIYLRRENFPADAFGEIGTAHPHHAEYAELIAETTGQGYARLVG